jgi:carboxyl-terminal processing protease
MAMPTLFSERLTAAFRLPAASAGTPVALEPYETYLAVRDTIMTEYANPPKDAKANREWPNKLNNMAIKGMVASVGDIYTEYWTSDEFKKQMETTSGSFGGVGARLDVRDHKPLIVEPIPNSPAMAKGLMSGDLIRAVDGKSAVISPSQRLDDVIKRIKGEPGTKVRLTIERKGSKPFDVDLVRAIVTSPVVDSWMLDSANGIGYVKLDQFTEQADVQVAAAIAKLQTQGMKALVFDLRGNPGGLLTVARDMVSRFVAEGPVVWTKERQGGMVSLNVDSKRTIPALSSGSIPVVVLVNGSSASASEIVSGALQDANAAFIIGTRTYGKGLVQTILPLGDTGGAVKVTTQH